MRCAYVIPTANPSLCSECFAAWRSMGWDTIALVGGDAEIENATDIIRQKEYLGWGESFNMLARGLADDYDFFGTGGDDCFPDPKRCAESIGNELSDHFGGTMGVCQAIGDTWAWGEGRLESPICFAPFIGAEFARRWNGGQGAFWPDYFQWFADNELYRTTKASGLLWERPDLTVSHLHVSRFGKPSPEYKTSKHHRWQADHDLFEKRKREGFPGHSPAVS